MKALVTFALLALFAITGEAAIVRAPLIIIAVDHKVNFSLAISGDIPTAATIYFFEGTDFDCYQENIEARFNPTYVTEFSAPVNAEGITEATARYTKSDLENLNNAYFEIFVDADNWMIGRLGESPDFQYTYEGDVEPYHVYSSSASIKYVNGYIAPFHTGPDPTPEPTSGLLLLVGAALLALRRRNGDWGFGIRD